MKRNTLLLLALAGAGAYYWFVMRPKSLAARGAALARSGAAKDTLSPADQAAMNQWMAQNPGALPV